MASKFQDTEKAFQSLNPIIKELQESVNKLKEDLIGLGEANKKQAKSQSDLTKKTNTAKKAVDAISDTQKELNKIRNKSLKVTKEVIRARELEKQRVRDLTEEIRREESAIKKRNGLFKSMTKSILAAGAAMLTFRAAFTVIKNGFKTIVEFEKGMSKVRAITGASAEAFKALQKNAIALGSSTSKTAIQVAQLQTEFAKLGFTTDEILAATKATIELSIAAETDLANAATVAASTVRGFGLSASETQRVVDVMARSFSSSALDLEKFKTAMAIVAPVAKASGKSLEFATSQLAILADAGLDASTAGTSLRNMFLELNKQGLTWEEGLEQIRNSTNKNVTALELFGKRGATTGLILAETTDKTKELEIALDGAAGAAKEMADIMEDNLAGDVNKAKSAWEGFILGLNDGTGALSKAGRGVVQFGTRAIRSLNTLDLWFKSEKRFDSDDFRRLLENMDFVKTESGKRIAEIIGEFEKLNKGVAVDDLMKQNKQFIDLFVAEGESREAAIGLWNAYYVELEAQRETEIAAELAAIRAKEDAEIEALRIAKALEDEKTAAAIEAARKRKEAAIEFNKEAADYAKNINDETAKAIEGVIGKELDQFDIWSDEIAAIEEEVNNLVDSEFSAVEASIDKQTQAKLDYYSDDLEAYQEYLDKKQELEDAAISAGEKIITDRFNARIDNELNTFQEQQEVEADLLKNRLDKGVISEAEYEAEIKKLRLKTRIEEAKASKKKALFEIAIATAVGVAKAIPNIPLMILAAGAGLVQAAAVALEPLPKFRKGEVNIDGPSHEQGGKIVEIEGRESIINRMGTANAPKMLEAINAGLLKDSFLPNAADIFRGVDSPELLGTAINIVDNTEVVNELKATRKAILNQRQSGTKITDKGMKKVVRSSNNESEYIDKYLRHSV